MHDAVEQSLLKEVAILRECQDKFRGMLEKVQYQYKFFYRLIRVGSLVDATVDF